MLLRDLTHDILPPRAVLLSDDVVLMVVPHAGDSSMVGHPGLVPPYGTVAVQSAAGSHCIAAMRLPAKAKGGAWPGGSMAQEGLAATLGSDAIELADELDPASCRRLLGFLLGFCRTAFGLAADAGFTDTCIRLARLCARDAGTAEPIARATPAWMVLSGVTAPPDATLYLLGADRVRHSAAPAMGGGSEPHLSGLQLVEPVRNGDLLLALCDQPLLWTVQGAANALPDVLQQAPGGQQALSGPAGGALRTACLRALAPAGGPAAALLREMQVLAPAAPRRHDDPARPLGAALEIVLPDGAGGIFLRGWLRDPLQLIAGAELRTPVATAFIAPGQLHRFHRSDIASRYAKAAFPLQHRQVGFVAHVPDPSGGFCAQPSLALRLRSGNAIEVTAPLRQLPPAAARDVVLSCVPPELVTPAMLDACLAPAAAALHRQAMTARGAVDVVQIGALVRQPTVTMLVPLYRNLDFLRFQAAALAADPECRRAELIYVLDSPEQRVELEFLLRGLHGLHGLAFTMVVMPCNLGFAAAINAGAALARGPALLLLNSDVVPARAGWLGAMRAALAGSGVGAVGPKLLFDDGSIQHAGLYFERDADGMWFNAHYHKGMPRHWPAAQRRRRVPGVTGAALMVRRGLFEAVGGLCEDYIIGDFEDSDLCLWLHGAGAGIVYVPEAELFHFERRSIGLHAGYSDTLASLYNRRLHHRRWDGTIATLMARRAHRLRSNSAPNAVAA